MLLNNCLLPLLKRIPIVIAIALAGGLIAYFIASHDDITYEASVSISVATDSPKALSQIDENAKNICKGYKQNILYYMVRTSIPGRNVVITIADTNQKNSKNKANEIGKKVFEDAKLLGSGYRFELKEATSTKKISLSNQKKTAAITGGIASGIIAAAGLVMISLKRKKNDNSFDDTVVIPKVIDNGGGMTHA